MQKINDKITQWITQNYKKFMGFTLDYITAKDIDSRKELLHETVLSVLTKESKYDTTFNNFSGYFRGCMKFVWLNSNRGKYKLTSIEDLFTGSSDDSEDNYERYYEQSDYKLCTYNEGERNLLNEDLLNQINKLNPLPKFDFSASMVIEMYSQGYEQLEIAKILNVPLHTIRLIFKDIREDFGILDNHKRKGLLKQQRLNKTKERKALKQKPLYKGVHYHEEYTTNKWAAQIYHNQKAIYIGAFKTPNEAAVAYNKKAIELKGDKAVLNTIKT